MTTSRTFGEDVALLQAHGELVLLRDGEAQVAVTPDYQGRVMTSTTGGAGGLSFGWLNDRLIERGVVPVAERAGRLEAHIHVFGGEDRFWLGPEGGQFGLFFAPGAPFEFEAWHTPAALDTEPFELVSADERSATFGRQMSLTNASGTRFDLRVNRVVRLLDRTAVPEAFGVELPASVQAVAYESDNAITNTGEAAWTPAGGLLSIWILGMYRVSPAVTVVIPFEPGPVDELGPKVNDAYFGAVPPDHLKVGEDVLFFRADGTRRGKIGLSPRRSKGIAGSYDAANGALTLVTYNAQPAPHGYVNSMWEHQAEPYAGDVINAYNDGPPAPGEPPLGPFYELETSSPAAALAPGETMRHVHRTLHLTGARAGLDAVAQARLGVALEAMETALRTP